MKVKVSFTWRNALATRFSADKIRQQGTPFRARKLTGFIDKKTEADVHEIRSWLEANEITGYKLDGVFTVHPDKVYYAGLAIEFKTEDDLMLFKLRF